MQSDIQRVLLTRERIAQRVAEVARTITHDLQAAPERPHEITLVPILTGSIIFVADLIRCLPVRLQIHLISVSSYPGTATSPRGALIEEGLTKLPASLAGQHVLLIDDILDSGQTLRLVHDVLARKNPQSVRTCVLLRKQRPAALALPVEYVCFDIPDEFVVGYGLDFNDYYRNLPDICTLKPEVIAAMRSGAPQK